MSTTIAAPPVASAPDQLTDEEVALRILDGEAELFEILMRRHNRRLFRATRSIIEDDAEAEDVVQDAYVRAYAHLDSFEGRSKFATWLTRIAVYEALARKRRGDRIEPLEAGDFDMEHSRFMEDRIHRNPEQQVIDGQLREVLEAAIGRLPLHYRTVFVLRDVEGLDTAETAECLGIQQQAVKTRLHRARGILKEFITTGAGPGAESLFNFLGARCDRIVAAVLRRILA